MNKRRKFSSSFKTKVVLEALSERFSVQELGRKYEVHPNQISKWKSQFLANAEQAFDQEAAVRDKEEQQAKEDALHRVIGQQKIEIDFLKRALS